MRLQLGAHIAVLLALVTVDLCGILRGAVGVAKPSKTECMSRKRYRTDLGAFIEWDQDVYHIISVANGGADHQDNYDLGKGYGWNRAIGANFDHINCFLAGRTKCEKAVAVSMRLGSHTCTPGHRKHKKYTGPSAAELYRRGEAAWRDFRTQQRALQKGEL